MEFDTYRYYGHSMSDPGKRYVCSSPRPVLIIVFCSYRTSQEVKEKRKKEDAIACLEEYAIQGNLVTEEEMKARSLYCNKGNYDVDCSKSSLWHIMYTCTLLTIYPPPLM